MIPIRPTINGRGSADNPPNRFDRVDVVDDVDHLTEADAADRAGVRPPTVYLRDTSRSIIAANDSPDVGFTHSLNPYRGCAHGCCYCYARPTHEYLGFSAGLDFETKVLVKTDAAALLRRELASPPVGADAAGVVRRHRRLPAGRAAAGHHPRLPGRAGRVPPPGHGRDQEPPGHPRPGPPVDAGGRRGGPGLRVGDDARPPPVGRHRTPGQQPRPPAGRRVRPGRGRRPPSASSWPRSSRG